MPHGDPAKIRNVALVGHRGTGKTTLVEALLYCAGQVSRMGSISAGTTVCDYDEVEQKHHLSLQLAIAPMSYGERHINPVDTPGDPGFLGDVLSAFGVVEGALLCVHGANGIQIDTENLWDSLEEQGIPRIVVMTALDFKHDTFEETLESLKRTFSENIVAVALPLIEEDRLVGVVDLLEMKAHYKGNGPGALPPQPIPQPYLEQAERYHDALIDHVAERDDALIEKYLNGDEITREEMAHALKEGVVAGRFYPLLPTSASELVGIDLLAQTIIYGLPSPARVGSYPGRDPATDKPRGLAPRKDAHLAAAVFKTVSDPHVGHLSLLRIYSGTLNADSDVINAQTGKHEHVGRLMRLCGKEGKSVSSLGPGDMGAVAKLKDTHTNQMLCDSGYPLEIMPPRYPDPALTLAVIPGAASDDEKLAAALKRACEEDPTLQLSRDSQSHRLLLSGFSQPHLELTLERITARYGLSASTATPPIAYRETVSREASAQGKYKRQTGGRGQYGDAWVRLRPLSRGAGFSFINHIVGGVIPHNYIPAVEKGVEESLSTGPLAGYPLVDIEVELYDGSHHPVDSSEMAFKIAGSMALKAALEKAEPQLLEPVMEMTVETRESYVGDILGDLNARRGQVTGVEPLGSMARITAHVPQAEVLRYASELRALTGGRARFNVQFLRYEALPAHLVDKVPQYGASA